MVNLNLTQLTFYLVGFHLKKDIITISYYNRMSRKPTNFSRGSMSKLEYALIIYYIYTSNKSLCTIDMYNELVHYIQSLVHGYNSTITNSDKPNYDKVSLILNKLRNFKYDDFIS